MSIMMSARERVANELAGSLYDNPVVIKAFRTRMRGWKAFVVMGAYVGLMTVVLLIAYFALAEMYSHSGMNPFMRMQPSIGKSLFGTLTWAQAFLLTLIIPALSSGALTHELEKKTIEMLALTPLSAGRIVLGKQVSDFLYTLILLMCSAPLSGLCLMLGGISPMEIFVTYLLLIAWVFLLTCSAVMWSSLSKKTASASGNNFGLCLLYFIVTMAMPSAVMAAGYFTHHSYGGFPFMLLNPAYASAGVLQSVPVCGMSVSMAFIAMVLHVACGIMFLMVATTHVKYRAVERALPIRLLLLGLTVFIMWLSAGSSASSLGKGSVAGPGITLLVLGMLGAAIFATGAVKKSEKQDMFSYAFSPRRAFLSDIGGAIGFITLWTVLAYGTYGVTAALLRHTVPGAIPVGKIGPGFWTSYFQVGLSTLVIVAATAAVGVLASSLTKKRASAVAIVVLFVVVAFVGFVVVGINWTGAAYNPGSAVTQLAAFWPLTPILAATGDMHPGDTSSPTPPWINDAWIVTSVVYFLIGALALALAALAYRKTGGVVMED